MFPYSFSCFVRFSRKKCTDKMYRLSSVQEVKCANDAKKTYRPYPTLTWYYIIYSVHPRERNLVTAISYLLLCTPTTIHSVRDSSLSVSELRVEFCSLKISKNDSIIVLYKYFFGCCTGRYTYYRSPTLKYSRCWNIEKIAYPSILL